ncbi:hypothetical protein PX52LOC_06569 [Limnoglobus roseus]|uniref:Uncharacterized protein n=1 Tax=Limnoglobus roseus TaxID=2598579 RepID=A0A5C1ALQ0_9BACT|nr:hypothetical protein PX52LOC_06569 [Limnoglobus roseus]
MIPRPALSHRGSPCHHSFVRGSSRNAGRKVKKGPPGAKRFRSRSPKWYAQGVPGHPARKRIPLAKDKQVARRLLDDLVRRAERGNTDFPDVETSRKLLSELLAEFEADMALGLASRARSSKRVPSADQVKLTVQRVRDALAGCDFIGPADLDSAAPAKLTASPVRLSASASAPCPSPGDGRPATLASRSPPAEKAVCPDCRPVLPDPSCPPRCGALAPGG